MRVVTAFGQSQRRGDALVAVLLALGSLGCATAADAQVIEIGDDGTARTFSRPTRFVAEGADEETAASVTISPNPGDRFERAASAEGIDVHLLRAVAWTESRGRTDAVSPKGALGEMQLMPATAAELGVDPRDPDANIRGGARYLAHQLLRFQSVPLALAAYNAGPGAVLRWGGIPPFAETRAYVASILSRWSGPATPSAPRPSAAAPRPRSEPSLIEVP